VYTCLWKSISQLRSVTCRMGSHSVTCYPTLEHTPPSPAAIQADNLVK